MREFGVIHQPIRVFIADDHPIVRDGLSTIVHSDPRLSVVGTATSFADLQAQLSTTPADIVVLDISGMQGTPIAFVAGLLRAYPQLAVIIFSSLVDLAPELLQAGARGYIAKEELSSQLLLAIQAVSVGERYVSPVTQEYLQRCGTSPTLPRFAPQELSVLKLLAQGLGTEAIADQLGLGVRTVRNYLSQIRIKTGCDERTQLAAWYQRTYGVGE